MPKTPKEKLSEPKAGMNKEPKKIKGELLGEDISNEGIVRVFGYRDKGGVTHITKIDKELKKVSVGIRVNYLYPICPECGKNTIVGFHRPKTQVRELYCANGETNCHFRRKFSELTTPLQEPRRHFKEIPAPPQEPKADWKERFDKEFNEVFFERYRSVEEAARGFSDFYIKQINEAEERGLISGFAKKMKIEIESLRDAVKKAERERIVKIMDDAIDETWEICQVKKDIISKINEDK